MIARSYKYRIYPTQAQQHTLEAWQSACLDVQRLCVIERRQHSTYVRRCKLRSIVPAVKAPNWASQSRAITELRAIYPEWAYVPADVMSEVARRVDTAQKRAFDQTKKTGRFARIRWADSAAQVGLTFRGQSDRGTHLVSVTPKYGYWKLASAGTSLGVIKARMHRPLPDGVDIRQAHITRNASGWYISFSCLIPDVPPAAPADKAVNGVDIGCIHEGNQQRIAVVDDGRVFTATDHQKRTATHLAHLQKMVSTRRVSPSAKHADPKSKRTAKRRARIAKLQARITRQRDHVLHYVARRLVDTANAVAFEDLNLQGMRAKGKGRRKSGLNRSMAAAAPGHLIALAQEKAAPMGRAVVKVDARNTSQICSTCGSLPAKKGLNVRAWTCAACGAQHDRDVNAARNIASRAMNNAGAFSAGVPGEGAAVVDRKRRPVNLEGALAPGGENTASTLNQPVRNSEAFQRKQRVSRNVKWVDGAIWHQEAFFD